MRRALLLIPLVVVACSKAQQSQENTGSMGAMALTDADVAGTWTGTSMPIGSDSVITHWTQVCANGACTGTSQEMADTIRSTYTLSGDSAVGKSAPFADPNMGGANVIDMWVARPTGGNVVGTGAFVLADNPDSVLARYHFEGSRM
jgi:hypothetical protein